jgi:hypothetical protein
MAGPVRSAGLVRSAGFQPAVSQASSLQSRRLPPDSESLTTPGSRTGTKPTAANASDTVQVKNLRYSRTGVLRYLE